jgi:uncharacterized protein
MFSRCIRWICRSSLHSTPVWLVVILFSCLFSAFFLRDISLDTNIARLLPDQNPVSLRMKALREPLGDGGYFTILLEGADRATLQKAAGYVNDHAGRLADVAFASYRNPIDFITKYKYTLLPVSALERLYDYSLRLEAELNPFGSDLLGEDGNPSTDKVEKRRQQGLEKSLEQLRSISEFHENDQGTVIGIIIYPKSMITELEAVRKLYNQLEGILRDTTKNYNVTGQIGGSQIKNLREYKSIIEDLGTAGTISGIGILAVLLFCFRSLRNIPVVVLPLFVGLAWSFAFVPHFIGPLNVITVFLLLILFGMGIDYSIHLIHNFQMLLQTHSVADALHLTFSTTGKSVIISGLTTAFPLFILSFSKFRGFSDYGMIGGWSIIMMLTAMFTVLPVLLVIAEKKKLITAGVTLSGSFLAPDRKIFVPAILFIVASCSYTFWSDGLFDYNFSAHSSDAANARIFDTQHKEVYKYSMVPAALYLAPNLGSLDTSLTLLTKKMVEDHSTIERLASVRDFAPSKEDFQKRTALLNQIREIFQGNWYQKISDPKVKQWVEEFRSWHPPDEPATINSLPAEINNYFLARDGSQQFLLGVYPAVSRRNGHEVLAFCDELEQTKLPKSLQGPVGEGIIFAEILNLVLYESPIMFFFAMISVAVPICVTSNSLREVAFTLFPLISGMAMLFGIMVITGMKINYLSIVILPTLLGLGVDDGVHYFRHCKSHGYNVQTTQDELFGTLSVCTLTTMIGYLGLVLAHNRGLQSLGNLACLGMACLWFTSVFLLPAMLQKWPVPVSPTK